MRPELILSILAICISLGSLGWTIVSWRRTGPVVKVDVSVGFLLVQTGTKPAVIVTAVNVGRLPVGVKFIGFEAPDGGSFIPHLLPGSTELPGKIEAHDDASWMVDFADLGAALADHKVNHFDLRAYVRLAGDRRVYAKRRGVGMKRG